MDDLKLISPSLKYKGSFADAIQEFEQEGNMGFWRFPDHMPKTIENFVKRLNDNAKSIDLPPGWVPSNTFWLIKDKKFIGHINIRHELTDYLLDKGGHIGYAIRPSERKKGYGSILLKLALPKAKTIGLKKVLITCDKSNIPSRKIIEKNGAIQEDERPNPETGDPKLRFWIDL